MTADPPSNEPDISAAEPPPQPDSFAESRSPYPPASASPVLLGPEGIRFDFNLGCRVLLPPRAEGRWHVRLSDLDTGNILFESEN